MSDAPWSETAAIAYLKERVRLAEQVERVALQNLSAAEARADRLAARVEELERERDALEGIVTATERIMNSNCARADRLAALLKEAGEVLRFYADAPSWRRGFVIHGDGCYMPGRTPIEEDEGRRARAILARLDQEGKP